MNDHIRSDHLCRSCHHPKTHLPPPADLDALDNPASDKHYGDNRALQYGVSSAVAGAANHFFSADTRIVFGINALEIGLVELFEMGLKRYGS